MRATLSGAPPKNGGPDENQNRRFLKPFRREERREWSYPWFETTSSRGEAAFERMKSEMRGRISERKREPLKTP